MLVWSTSKEKIIEVYGNVLIMHMWPHPFRLFHSKVDTVLVGSEPIQSKVGVGGR